LASEREYDVVLFGGTGFTGGLTAEHLVAHAASATRLALAGRNPDKLEALRERLGRDLPLLSADVSDRASIDDVAAKARVVITTVGPYVEYGEPLVAACAEHGASYVDLTGEPEFVDRMYVRYDARARETGARIVHSCGFESIPPDLGALLTVEQLPEDSPLRLRGFVSAKMGPSGGTFATMLSGLSRPRQNLQATRERRAAEPPPAGRRVRAERRPPHRERGLGWVVPMPTIDPQVVLRSARSLERYGPDFTYGHYFVAGNPALALGLPVGVAGLFAAAQVPPLRRALLARLPSGSGPSEEQRAKSWFKLLIRGEGGGERAAVEVTGGDPGYTESSKMLAEAALCLAEDDLPASAGQVTPAVAMGHALIERLHDAGIGFTVDET
jgi:short subunit dehydrogenase-like uncharacterized protein